MKRFLSVDTDTRAIIISEDWRSYVNDTARFKPVLKKTRERRHIGNATADNTHRYINYVVSVFIGFLQGSDMLTRFPHWLNGQINQLRKWYNKVRFHCGIKTVPMALYVLL